MYKRQGGHRHGLRGRALVELRDPGDLERLLPGQSERVGVCLLYTSDAADERSSVDLGGRRIIKKKTKIRKSSTQTSDNNYTSHNHS